MKCNSVEFVADKCIKCTKCVIKCKSIGIEHICMKGAGKDRYIDFIDENPCTKCGQCTLVCPVASMIEKSNIDDVKNILKDKNKLVIVQSAPSVRTSINEIFKMDYNPNMERKLNTCYRLLGFDKIFDVNFGADITSFIEAEEFLERLDNKDSVLPMFTSCCPSWVNFVKLYKPEFLPNLTTAMSPHIHSGMAYKTWWAEQEGVDPKNITVVSIMPCTSKKEEIYEYNGFKAVDYVLTVRELAKLIVEKGIDFKNLEESDGDVLSKYSAGGAIYGKSGGVMESALRIIKRKIDNENLNNFTFKDVENDGVKFKEAVVSIGGKDIYVAVISSPKNFRGFIDKNIYKNYQYIEVMHCEGGCINGGGQPLLPPKPNSEYELIEKRKNVLNKIDIKLEKNNALDNNNLNEYVKWAKTKPFEHELFHVRHEILKKI